MEEELEALHRIIKNDKNYSTNQFDKDFDLVRTKIKALNILANNLGVEMSIDGDFALLFVKVLKDINDPQTYNYCIVGSVEGKENIETLKCALKHYENLSLPISNEKLVREIMGSKVVKVKRAKKGIRKMSDKIYMTLDEQQKQKEGVLTHLSAAGICSARNGGNGFGITLTDFQINYLRDLVKGDLEKC